MKRPVEKLLEYPEVMVAWIRVGQKGKGEPDRSRTIMGQE